MTYVHPEERTPHAVSRVDYVELDENEIAQRIEMIADEEFSGAGPEFVQWMEETWNPDHPEYVPTLLANLVGGEGERLIAHGMARGIRGEWEEYCRNSEYFRTMAIKRIRGWA